MTMQNLYMSEKDRDFIKKRVIGYENGDIIFREVEGYRKDVLDVKLGKEIILDNMEKKMRLYDVIKQYELFFNQKLKIYDKKYINELVELLDNNDLDYLKKRKELSETKRHIPLFRIKPQKIMRRGKLYNTINKHEKKFSQTLNDFNPNKRKLERKITTKSLLSSNDKNKKEDSSLNALDKAVENEKKNLYHYYLNSAPNLYYNFQNISHEKKLFVYKMIKKKKLSQFKLKKEDELQLKEYNSASNTIGNKNKTNSGVPKFHHKFRSCFEESLNENSLMAKKLRNQNFFLRRQQIKTLDIIKKNPIIFQRPYSMLGDYCKSHKLLE